MVKNNPCWRCYIQRRLLCPEWLTMCTSTTSTSICTDRWLARSYNNLWSSLVLSNYFRRMYARQKYGQHCSYHLKYQCCSIQIMADHWDQLTRHCSRSLPSSLRNLQSSHQKPRHLIERQNPYLCIGYNAFNVENDASNLLTAAGSTS